MLKTQTKEVPDVVYTKGDKKLEIYRDQHPVNPREESNLGIMRCAHGSYDLGDEDISGNEGSWAGERKKLEEEENPIVVLPLYLYDHSGLAIKVGSFDGQLPQGHARFDSGQVGFIYTTEEKLKEIGVGTGDKDKLKKYLKEEVERYHRYISGDVWRYVLYEDGEQVDSCAGFYGTNWSENGLLDYAGIDDLEDWEEE